MCKAVLMFDSLLDLCPAASGSGTVSAVYHKTPAVRNDIKRKSPAEEKTLAQEFQAVSH